MVYLSVVMEECMRFLTHEWNVFGFYMSFWQCSMLVMAFKICLNFIAKAFGQREVVH
ncbi:MAG: hypothetical protein J6S67_24240 [Methanobrevibacter sp.]|nr:hypothetical protein [Methanobrevibacter sp.]